MATDRRVYFPATLHDLARAHATGVFPAPAAAHTVTTSIREWYVEGDLEELEYVALTEASEASLRLLAADPDAPRRRVVIAADVAEADVSECADERFRSAARVGSDVPVSAVASVHVDEKSAAGVVAQAIIALDEADRGDDDARFVLDEAEATELLWYDVSEIGDLI
ncbi:MAG: hypothetical protein QG622_2612 [Actinomycetota bacterium]|nr:hypothetical protein [Actinomycetota bacterium]